MFTKDYNEALTFAEYDIKMEDEAGKFFTLPRFPGIQFMVMYNPAFLLRDPSKKTVTWEHLKALRNSLRERKLV